MTTQHSFLRFSICVLTGVFLIAFQAFGFAPSIRPSAGTPVVGNTTGTPGAVTMSVGLVSFTGNVTNGIVTLNWQTATETNCYGFNIERETGTSGIWTQMGFVQGSGTSNIAHSYQYSDAPATSNSYSYRLKEISNDGQFAYSNVVAINVIISAPAAPTGTFTASTTTLPSTGGTITLTWTSANATTVSIDQGVGSEPLNGSATVSVTATKTFTMTATNSVGVTAKYTVTITVAPPIVYQTVISAFSAGPSHKTSVLLKWTTSSESHNSGFDIQRKKGTGSYAKIGNVAGIGNSTTPTNYQYTDPSLKSGTYYYRLNQINTDGTSAYSPEVSVQVTRTSVTTLTSYPNPFNPTTNISFTAAESGHATMKIYNVIGQVVATLFNGDVEAGDEHTVTFNAASLATGLYFSVLETGGERMVLKVLYSK
jgi:hypothetical protein